MSRYALRSIRTKLLVAFAAISIVPLVAYGLLATREATSQLEHRAGLYLEKAADESGEKIAAYLHERVGDVGVFSANLVAATGTPAEVGTLADVYARDFAEYDLIVVTDAQGTVLATNSMTGDHKPVDRAAFVGRSMRGQAWYDQVATGQVPVGGTYLSNAELDPQLAQVTHGLGQGFTVAAGIYDASGHLLRVWSSHVSWARSIGATLDRELASMKADGNLTVGLELIDKTGVVIDDEDETNNFKVNLVTMQAGYAKRGVAGERGFVREADPMDKSDDVVGFAPVREHGGFAGNGWTVLAHQQAAEIAAATTGLRNFGLIAIGAVILFVIIAGFLVARSLSRPMIAGVAALQRVADGDLTARAPVVGRDEMAQMNGALNTALERLSQAFSTIGGGVIALAQSSRDLSTIGGSLNDSAGNTSRQASAVAAASEQAGKNVQTVASGTEEMSVTIKEIAKSAAAAARVATDAVSSAQRTTELVAKLGNSSTEIGNVLQVISQIAEQTNLLALNATIEAARAGEAGKGFAVVANEVKELAKETAKATDDITRRIAAIQSDATSAITAIAEITRVIGEINDIQSTIASSVEEQAATTNEIGRNLHELAQASNEIAQNVTGVASAADSTSQCSTQTLAAASSLTELSKNLEAEMGRFRYEEARSTTLVQVLQPMLIMPRAKSLSTGPYAH